MNKTAVGVDPSRIVQKWLWAGAAGLAPWRRGILLKPYRAIYISVPKVACTSFKTAFAELLGLSLEKAHGDPHRVWYPSPVPIESLQRYLYPGFFRFAFVRNPWGWISYRLSNLNWLWVGLPWTPPPGAGLDWWARYLEGSLYVASLLVGLWLLARGLTRTARAEDRRMLVLQAAIVLLCLGANAAMFAVVHYEERYSLPLRLLCLWTTATVVASSSLRNGT